MTFREERMDLFDVDESYYLAHCVASDIRMGAGIAVPMNRKFGLRRALLGSGKSLGHPTCVLTGRVFNLITKARSSGKPTVSDFMRALLDMRDMAAAAGVRRLAMPRIGCGLDGLSWSGNGEVWGVRDAIKKAFFETDVEILVCFR